jgi:poly(hydroxyalkanoate) depolymerase family esterase
MRFTPILGRFKPGKPFTDATAMVRQMMQSGMPLQPLRPMEATQAGHFIASTFKNAAGGRPYKLYIPSTYHGQTVPLVVMLHGCTQSPDDFAAGTRMNEAAEAEACLVAYPAQTSQANMQRCWNWFNEADQRRGHGEPAIIAGITQEIMATYAVDPSRVYVAGLSAGGAQAAIMADAYPELYAAVCVHSGLACGAAKDISSAISMMRSGGRVAHRSSGPKVPTIVFHGDVDSTVHPSNSDEIIAQVAGPGQRTRVEQGHAPTGHAYRRTLTYDANGRVIAEQWLIAGGNHGWSGGSPAGSFTDPAGPDATREMLRFFLEHPRANG